MHILDSGTEMPLADGGSVRDEPIPSIRVVPRWGRNLAPLPMLLTSFIGREQELALLADLLQSDDISLISLTGAGGVGKTRLAIRAANAAAATFRDGVAFVSLADILDPDLVLPAVAHALGLRAEATAGALDALASALHQRHLLLVLDNLEQVRAAGPDLHTLLAASPHLCILATTRQRLRLSGEVMVHVAPLPTPMHVPNPELADVFASDAVRLFVSRTRDANPHFELTSANKAAVTEICRRLDGLPLAIELAAARGNVLPPAALLERLERDLPLLSGGPADAPARQRTLYAAIAWSESLLTPEEQALFARLSVFRGGFTLAGAMAISSDNPSTAMTAADEIALLDHWSPLVDHGLLVRQDTDVDTTEPRFTMLETIAAHARLRLEQSGASAQIHRRHAHYFRDVAAEAAAEINGPRQKHALDALERDSANLRAALAWSIENGQTELSLTLAADLSMYWLKRGHVAEGRAWLGRALSLPAAEPSPSRLRALIAMALLAGPAGDIDRATEALTLARQRNDASSAAKALNLLGNGMLLSNPVQAAAYMEQSLELLDTRRDWQWHTMLLLTRGMVADQLGDLDRAVASLEATIELSAHHGEVWCQALALSSLASVIRPSADPVRVVDLYIEALQLGLDHGYELVTNEAFLGLGGVLASGHRAPEAVRLFGAAEAAREAMGISLHHLMLPKVYARDLAAARRHLSEEAFAAKWAEGRGMEREDLLPAAQATRTLVAGSAPSAPRQRTNPAISLTAREIEVLRLVAEHRTDREIATILYIGVRTVEFHLSNILGKLGAENRREAAAFAVRLGLI